MSSIDMLEVVLFTLILILFPVRKITLHERSDDCINRVLNYLLLDCEFDFAASGPFCFWTKLFTKVHPTSAYPSDIR